MGRSLPPLLLTTCVAACAPCPTLEQASVWDPHDRATPEQVLTIQQTMEGFATTRGFSDLCVLGVRIRPIRTQRWPASTRAKAAGS